MSLLPQWVAATFALPLSASSPTLAPGGGGAL